jgi:hypothetical protein
LEELKMPQGDKTGPAGQGPLTGRKAGYCAGFNMPGFAFSGFGFRRFGRCRGFGFRRMWFPQFQTVELSEDEEKKILESELKELELEKKEIEKALKKFK